MTRPPENMRSLTNYQGLKMRLHFEELTVAQRMGGIEAATCGLATQLAHIGVEITRSSGGAVFDLPDCVHLHGVWSPRLARKMWLWRKKGVPCVVSPHGMLEPWALSHKQAKKKAAWHLYQRWLLGQAAVLHGTSEREIAQFRALGLRSPAVMVPWGVSVSEGKAARPTTQDARVALFVGRVFRVKGLLMLVEAWARVRPEGWKLKIVGPDEARHQAEVEAAVRKAGIASVVEFTGELTGLAKDAAYAGSSLFVMPSYAESFGMAIAEALAHSLPVITTTGTPWSLLPERGCGWWVAPTVECIANALASAAALDDETLRCMGTKGRDWVVNDYGWQQTAQKMKVVYSWALGRRAKPEYVV